MPIPADADSPPAAAPAGAAADDAAAGGAASIEQLQGAVEAASAEARGAVFYYTGFGLYFAIAVAGTSHEDLLRGSTVAMPGLGIGLPVVGFYAVVPMLFVVFHAYALLQLVILSRRIGWLKLALRGGRESPVAPGHQALLSPFAISQRLFGEPRGLVPQILLRLSIWLSLVLIPVGLLLATEVRFLPYHSTGVTWSHRLYIVIDVLLLLLLWPTIIDPERRAAARSLIDASSRAAAGRPTLAARARRGAEVVTRYGLALAVFFVAFVVATIPDEALERALLRESEPGGRADCSAPWRIGSWLDTVRLPDRRDVLCVTYRFFEAPDTPFGLRRNMVVRGASLVVVEPTREQIAEVGLKDAWASRGKGADLQNRDLRFADLSGSDLRRADLRGANLQGAVLEGVRLTAAKVRDTPLAEVGSCAYELDDRTDTCLIRLVDADLVNADLRLVEGWKIDLRGANLTAAKLQGAALQNGRLAGALLPWADLRKAQLDDADLRGAVLREVRARKATLNSADLTYALVQQVDLAMADLKFARLDGTGLAFKLPSEPSWRRSDHYEVGPSVALELEVELTAALFRRACEEGPLAQAGQQAGMESEEPALRARGVVRRVWHEFDYSKSHDQAGYAPVADLRYLLARLILSPPRCQGADLMPERDADQLQKFLAEWCAWKDERSEPGKGPEPDLDLERAWDDLSARLFPAGEAAGTEKATVTNIWQRLDAELSDQPSCPELRESAAADD